MLRTKTCGELSKKHIGETVTLAGWVHRRRDHGGVIFIDLRDRYGLTQVKFDPDANKSAWEKADRLRSEWVIQATGEVISRPDDMINKKMETGEVEVRVDEITVLNKSKTPPFELDDMSPETKEEVRLEYRYLDLRRDPLQKMLKLRDDLLYLIRTYMRENSFVEVQTPLLANSSPEGSRDWLVPCRVHPGKFYALPQAPQQFKELLMCGGIDRYFQIAATFRDEDPRADRAFGDFYQFDLEMSFVEQEDVFNIIEPLYNKITTDLGGDKKAGYGFEPKDYVKNSKGEQWKEGDDSWPRISFVDSMTYFGSDKPDLRFDLTIEKVTELFEETEFKVFQDAAKDKEKMIHALLVPEGASKLSRKDIDDLTLLAQSHHAKGLAWLKVGEESGPVAKNVEKEVLEKLIKKLGAKKGDLIFFGADEWTVVCESLGAVRKELGQKMLKLVDENLLAWAWITDFPFFEKSDDGGVDFMHNPFSMPTGGLSALNNKDPLEIEAHQYDFICNGYEVCSGAIRNHDPEVLKKAFQIVGHSEEDVEKRFGHMIKAFEYGAPPHGGAAPGIERTLMLLLGTENVRDTLAFPKTSSGVDLMMKTPSEVDEEQLKELGIKLKK